MLSRIAESFFWLGRYLERSEATARLLAEHHQLVIADASVPEDLACRVLLESLSMPPEAAVTAMGLVNAVVGSEADASTIAGAVAAARANARAVRESLSQDTYQALNAAHLALSRSGVPARAPGVALDRLIERLLVIDGVIDWTMPRDEAYLFLSLGRRLERIDMTSRLLDIGHDQLWPESGPVATLRAAAALSQFQRTGQPLTPYQVRAYLALDPAFPRSLRSCAEQAERAVRGLASLGVSESRPLLQEVGMLRSRLEFAQSPTAEALDVLISQARQGAARASDEAGATFFRQAGTIVWSH